MHSHSTPKTFYRSRSLGDLGQRSLVSCLSIFLMDCSSEATGSFSINFHMQPPGNRGKIDRLGPGDITKMAAMLISGKSLKNPLLQNHKANCLET